jgi:uncharacterized RDD family membrane protein YckC
MERQADHRMYLERTVVEGDSKRAWAGIVVAALISLAVLGVCVLLVMYGYTGYGVGLVIANLAVLAGTFIYGTNSRKQERIEKVRARTSREE